MDIGDVERVADFLERYLKLCRSTGIAIDGVALRIVKSGPGMQQAYVSRNPDHSLELRYVHVLPEPAPARVLPRQLG